MVRTNKIQLCCDKQNITNEKQPFLALTHSFLCGFTCSDPESIINGFIKHILGALVLFAVDRSNVITGPIYSPGTLTNLEISGSVLFV